MTDIEQQRAKQVEELKKKRWGAPVEANQWAIEYEQSNWDKDLDFYDQDKTDSVIYVRESPPPAAVKLFDGATGEYLPDGNMLWETYTDKPFEVDPGKQPFLFSKLQKRGELVKMGKLDDESTAMLKEKYGVDIGVPIEETTEEEDSG